MVHKLHELQVNKAAYEGSACHLSPETQEKQKQQLPKWHHLPTVHTQYYIVFFSSAKHIVMQNVQAFFHNFL